MIGKPTIPIIYAPTATGKSELIMKFCENRPCEICSMDSMQIYKHMDIGTAKPSLEDRKRVRHHLIDIVEPSEEYNVNRYRLDALEVVEQVLSTGSRPVFIGGTGLYMDVLKYGLFEGVPKDNALRDRLKAEEKESPGILRSKLKAIDRTSWEKIHPNDTKRIIRALEIYFKTGKTKEELANQREEDKRFKIIVLERDREELYRRINQRVEQMVEKGLIDETQSLLKKYSLSSQAGKAIGYRETIDFLNGRFENKDEYITTLKKNTRHYARRQIIWSRRYKRKEIINLSNRTLPAILRELESAI